jgi:hypothetical protein
MTNDAEDRVSKFYNMVDLTPTAFGTSHSERTHCRQIRDNNWVKYLF